MPAKKREPRTEVCVTVEKAGVWIYGNAQAFHKLAAHMTLLAASAPAEHDELHVRWHLGSSLTKRKNVFVLMDEESRRVHQRSGFEVTFMVVEAKELKALRRHERSGRLPRNRRRVEQER